MRPNRIKLLTYVDNARAEGFKPLHEGVFDNANINDMVNLIKELRFYGRIEIYIHDNHNYVRLSISHAEIELSTTKDLSVRIYDTLKRTFLDRAFINLTGG